MNVGGGVVVVGGGGGVVGGFVSVCRVRWGIGRLLRCR